MPPTRALATAVALADCLETYTSDVQLENIVRLAEAMQRSGKHYKQALLAPQELGNLIDALPTAVLKRLKMHPAKA